MTLEQFKKLMLPTLPAVCSERALAVFENCGDAFSEDVESIFQIADKTPEAFNHVLKVVENIYETRIKDRSPMKESMVSIIKVNYFGELFTALTSMALQ